ncbi:hypothetical protein B0H66DRAFT_198087 [Apodospora peruviana]|uniref:Uncharacterized protein n=1 Tax=Apodospora peruviana TaxID=516989 RepID=A0AAE0M7H8_9PEZI|nr:hypothetical protein B0H66DRAFT_198087 [Apodospora peruviana]
MIQGWRERFTAVVSQLSFCTMARPWAGLVFSFEFGPVKYGRILGFGTRPSFDLASLLVFTIHHPPSTARSDLQGPFTGEVALDRLPLLSLTSRSDLLVSRGTGKEKLACLASSFARPDSHPGRVRRFPGRTMRLPGKGVGTMCKSLGRV